MDGEEWGVDGLVYDGQYILGGITAKDRSAPPSRFDLGLHMPPLEGPEVVRAIVDATGTALAAIGFTAGTTHVEVIMTDAGPRIVEMAGRPGGARIPTDLIPLAHGMDFMADSLRIALGERPKERRRHERGAAIYWIPAEPGVVTEIKGLDEARAMPGVQEVVMTAKPGDAVEPIVDCVTRDKIGYVLTASETVEAAIDAAKRARNVCRVITRPVDSAAMR